MEEFWRDKEVLVTGHTGFKGAWLSLLLGRLGARVSGFALPPEHPRDLFEVARLAERMHSHFGDVRGETEIREVVDGVRPDVIFHLAAQSLVRRSYREPVETYATNVMGTAHLLEAVRACGGVRVVVVVTSDKCYENHEWVWGYREGDTLGGHDPYSSSKACAEMVAGAYRSSYFPPDRLDEHGVALATVRAGNVIGGGDWAEDRLVPDIMRALTSGTAVDIRNPDAVRPWQHVLGALHGYLRLSRELWRDGREYTGAWNFGPRPEDARPVRWVVERICELWGDGAGWVPDPSEHPSEARTLRLDCSKARELLGWQPRLPLSRAVEWCVEWYRGLDRGRDIEELTDVQIERFIGGEAP